jgi:hypothetical protein
MTAVATTVPNIHMKIHTETIMSHVCFARLRLLLINDLTIARRNCIQTILYVPAS